MPGTATPPYGAVGLSARLCSRLTVRITCGCGMNGCCPEILARLRRNGRALRERVEHRPAARRHLDVRRRFFIVHVVVDRRRRELRLRLLEDRRRASMRLADARSRASASR
jgi:hypothetical protein